MTYREALNLALSEEMRRDGRVFVIGGGLGSSDADEGTLRLLDEFDPRRVVHTHIAESGFAGVGIGAAMVGLRPVVELMTFDFVTRALDQIVNTAARLIYVSGGQYNVPIVIRGRGDPVHQLAVRHPQSMARYFVDVPGLKVVGPSTPADAKGLLKSAIRDNNPVIFIESETLYSMKGEVPDDPDFTIPLELEKDSISVEIVDPRTLRPMDERTIVRSVRKTHRAVVVDSGLGLVGLHSEIASFIGEQAFDDLDAPVERVMGADTPTSHAKNLEHLKMPTQEKIVAAVRRVCDANGN